MPDDPFESHRPTRLRPGSRRPPSDGVVRTRGVSARPLAPPDTERFGSGLNPLVRAATPLVLLTSRLRATASLDRVGEVRRDALAQIRRFEDTARTNGVEKGVVVAARYAICAALDEAVLATPWGARSIWAQPTLLVELHHEAHGGEKFFEVLDAISKDPARFIDLMELHYLLLALGFAGKHESAPGGSARLSEIQRTLYRAIRANRDTPPEELSPGWRGLEDRRNPIVRYAPWWLVGAAVLATLGMAFTFLHLRLGGMAAPLHASLAQVGVEDFARSRPVTAVVGPTLRTLLASLEQDGAVLVEEDGGRTRITLLAGDLFPSGRATVSGAHAPTLQRVAEALNQIPGRILVEGHTDDQPIRSLRFQNNNELSSARAAGVERRLSDMLADPGRVASRGLGSMRPRYLPESENRARNRRVEILHVRE